MLWNEGRFAARITQLCGLAHLRTVVPVVLNLVSQFLYRAFRSPIIVDGTRELLRIRLSISVSSLRGVCGDACRTVKYKSLIFTITYIVLVVIDVSSLL